MQFSKIALVIATLEVQDLEMECFSFRLQPSVQVLTEWWPWGNRARYTF